MRVEGQIVDLCSREIYQGSVEVQSGVIVAINRHGTTQKGYIMPGFIDAHVHIESSMLTPEHFGQMVIAHGTVGVVTDPHEVANVMGVEGIEFMLESAKGSPIKINFSIPSSVPATPFDVSGGVITPADTEKLAQSGRFVALSEVMNVPGVLFEDAEVMEKLEIARRYNLVIDGHAPLLRGDDLAKYIASGITTDHECVNIEEAREKISRGIKVLIREGSAAKNYEGLKELIASNPKDVMFCTDDSHPDDILSVGHINKIVRRAVADGYPLFDLLDIATRNAVEHYKLDVGGLKVGDKADFIVVDDLVMFDVDRVYIDGEERYNRATPIVSKPSDIEFNNFNHDPISVEQLAKSVDSEIKVIGVVENELVTTIDSYTPAMPTSNLESDVEQDLVKIVYINRYVNGVPQVAYCRGYGLKRGAIASSIGHDSHNIVAVGCSDREIADAVNLLIKNRGGLSICDGSQMDILPLPIGGIMSGSAVQNVVADYMRLHEMVARMGVTFAAPFMTLSFLSLVVIPELKIGEKGLFSYSAFDWVE